MINKEYFPREDKKLGLVVNSLLHLTLENKVDSNSISVTNNLVTSTCTNDQTVVNEFQRMNLIEINDETNNIRKQIKKNNRYLLKIARFEEAFITIIPTLQGYYYRSFGDTVNISEIKLNEFKSFASSLDIKAPSLSQYSDRNDLFIAMSYKVVILELFWNRKRPQNQNQAQVKVRLFTLVENLRRAQIQTRIQFRIKRNRLGGKGSRGVSRSRRKGSGKTSIPESKSDTDSDSSSESSGRSDEKPSIEGDPRKGKALSGSKTNTGESFKALERVSCTGGTDFGTAGDFDSRSSRRQDFTEKYSGLGIFSSRGRGLLSRESSSTTAESSSRGGGASSEGSCIGRITGREGLGLELWKLRYRKRLSQGRVKFKNNKPSKLFFRYNCTGKYL
ncbi:hypothetical protein CmeUKMEL1_08110 [Cryptosporidium meleagridis]|uniref:Uncharacterized protein n=1 Tax=Cryptosporidium meleagridis TaxID=93969 RepID=A0A2P4Z0P6_9CRYT|nr:hypothetical protein CmeUKMEL1_08110 [Cryptosporidium meleagridis]